MTDEPIPRSALSQIFQHQQLTSIARRRRVEPVGQLTCLQEEDECVKRPEPWQHPCCDQPEVGQSSESEHVLR